MQPDMVPLFSEICRALHLGTPLAPPEPLQGGYTHRMFSLRTAAGHYAVKLLDPGIMQRPGVLANYTRAEALEALLEQQGLPILPALTIDGRKMHCVDGRYLYVFDCFCGQPLRPDAITPDHAGRIGEVLARIHGIDCREASEPPARPEPIDWPGLTAALLASDTARAEGEMMRSALPMLLDATRAADEALLRLPPLRALCHNDMDPKNVLWQGMDFRIIDLECLDYADPMQEMMDLAVSWSGEPLSEACFRAFLGGYGSAGGRPPEDPALLFDSRRNYLEWLAYNASRAVQADADGRRTGRMQIRWTLGKIRQDLAERERILRWFL